MQKKIVFNFFDDSREQSIQSLAVYFHLDKNAVIKYIKDSEKMGGITLRDFVIDFEITLSEYDSSRAEIICRHMTSMTEEGIEDIKVKGLLDLISVLTEDTVLSRFLRNNKVVFDVQKNLFVDGQAYRITTTDEQCLVCVEKKEIRCGRFGRCDIREKMDSIGHKIYQLGGTLEFFVSGNKVDMERYSVIHMNPEILETLDQLLAEIKVKSNRKEPFALSYKWREQERKRYILQFPVCLSDIEGICVCNYDRAYYDYQDILEYSGYNQDDYNMHLVPENFYQNMKIIEWFLGTVFDGGYQIGSLLQGKTVNAEKIQVKDICVR